MENTPPQQQHYAPPKKRSLWWVLWLIIGLFILMFGGCFMTILSAGLSGKTSASFSTNNGDLQEAVWEKDEGFTGKLAMVPIEGVITGQHKNYQQSMTDSAIKKIEQATDDKTVKGLLLYLNTPGGEVTASDKIYHAAMQFKETGRPIVAYMDTVAASGGYYIACAADEIIATETTITGSIGVILGGMNGKEMLDKIGLKSQTFKSGAFKDTLSMSRDMREDERVYIQGLVDQTYEKFAGIVSEARGIPLPTLKNGIADGRIFHGVKAKEVGLVDSTGYSEDAINALKVRAGLKSAKTIYYKSEPSLGDFIGMIGAKAQTDPEIKVDWGQGQFTQSMKPYVPYSILEGY